MGTENLRKAKMLKNDEFYTQYSDIEKELQHYKEHLKGKVIYSNCDSENSNFVKYFLNNKDELGYKDFLYSHYNKNNNSGDFRYEIEKLKQADIVITNPPFSLFREFTDLMLKYKKQFLILGSNNAISYKDIYNGIINNTIFQGINNVTDYSTPSGEIKKVATRWFTNIKTNTFKQPIVLTKEYNKRDYPKYDNYDAINCNKVMDIPKDYTKLIGVPISFMDKYNPNQFEILGIALRNSPLRTKVYPKEIEKASDLNACPVLKEGDKYKQLYSRLLIKRKI